MRFEIQKWGKQRMHAQFLWTKAKRYLQPYIENHQRFAWAKNARPNQLPPPGTWRTWLILAGRGFGKTRTGAETLRSWVNSGRYRRIALVSKTIGEAYRFWETGGSFP